MKCTTYAGAKCRRHLKQSEVERDEERPNGRCFGVQHPRLLKPPPFCRAKLVLSCYTTFYLIKAANVILGSSGTCSEYIDRKCVTRIRALGYARKSLARRNCCDHIVTFSECLSRIFHAPPTTVRQMNLPYTTMTYAQSAYHSFNVRRRCRK